MRTELIVTDQQVKEAAYELGREILTEITAAVAEETRGLELDLEGITRLAVKGKLWRAWRSVLKPGKGRIAKNPAGLVLVNGGSRSLGAMTFFTQEGRIAKGGGGYLAIPTDAAGVRGRKRDLTPREWEARTGQKLRFVYRRGRPSILVLDAVGITKGGKPGKALTRQSGLRRGVTVVIFVLVPSVGFSPRFAVAPLIERRRTSLPTNIERRMQRFA